MSTTPGQAHAVLKAAGLDPDEMREALAYLCGWAPDGVRAAITMATAGRRYHADAQAVLETIDGIRADPLAPASP